jgi:alanine racemase
MTQPPATAQRPTWCEIDLAAVTANLATIRAIVGPDTAICVCVKGDANGCGDVAVARTAVAAGASCIAFGNVERALAARDAGLAGPVMLYPCCLPDTAPALEAAGLMPSLSTLEDVALWSRHARALPVFLKLDGGGFRAGALPADAVAVARAIVESGTLTLAGVYGHPMTTYGTPDPVYTHAQVAACKRMIAAIQQAGIAAPIRIVSSSAILLSDPSADLNGVDPGRLVLGIDFPAAPGRERQWRPALVGLRSRLVMTKPLEDISGVMPAPFLPLRPGMRLGLIPYGWSDGFPKTMPKQAEVLVRGRRVRLLAPSHSEMLRVDLTDVPDAAVGDDVVLLGRDGAAEITLTDLAAQWGTTPSSLPTLVGRTLRRVYRT